IICPSIERWRAPLETALGTLGVPYAVDGEIRLTQTAFGHSLASLLRFAWLGGTRGDLFAHLRTPFSGVPRHAVDFVEGRLRGRAIQTPERVVEEAESLRGSPLPALDDLRRADDAVEAAQALSTRMLRNAYGLEAPPVGESSRLDLRAYEAVKRLLAELGRWQRLAGPLSREDLVAALDRETLRPMRGDEPGRIAVVDLMRARTRRFDVVFVLGLEEGSLPRRGAASPFLDDDARRALDDGGARLQRPDAVGRDRYLVREAATDDGSPREPSPFWEETQAHFDADDVRRWTRRRPLSALTWPVDGAPTERERRLPAADAHLAPARARAARVEGDVQRHGARALRRLLVGVVRGAFPLAEVDRRGGRRDAARLGRALRPAQVLRAAAEGARRREARRARGGGRRAPDARVPRRSAAGRRAYRRDGDETARARPDALARPRGG